MRVRKVEDEGAFAALGHEWDSVLEASREDAPCLRHDWLSAWWRAYGGRRRLAVLVCEDGGELVGVLPLYRSLGHVLPLRTLRCLGDEGPGALGLGPFARTELEEEVADCFAEHLRASGDWELLDLVNVEAGVSPFLGTMESAERDGVISRTLAESPQIPLPGSWDRFLGALGKRRRRTVRHAAHRAGAAGARLDIVENAGALPRALDDLARLFESRMRHVIGPGFRLDSATRHFLSLVLPRLLADDRLRLGFLAIGARRVAFDLQIRHRDTRYALMGGFDEAWASAEVSKALFAHMLENAIEEGCTALDFGIGTQEYKLRWGVSGVRRFSAVRIYAPTPGGALKRSIDTVNRRRQVLHRPAPVPAPAEAHEGSVELL